MMTNNFEQRFLEFSKYLEILAFRLTGDKDRAADLYQDTALLAFKNQSMYKMGTNLKAWLHTIMRNTFINQCRKRSRRGEIDNCIDLDYFIELNKQSVKNAGESSLLYDEVKMHIEDLSDKLRIPFLLYYQGFKYHEISDIMEKPPGTIKSRIHMARQKVKSKLEAQFTH